MPAKKNPLDNPENNNNKKTKFATTPNLSSFTEVDRGGNGDCIFRAVLDHFLPEANNQEIITLATGLRHLVVQEYRRLALERNINAANINREADLMEQQGVDITLIEETRKEAVNQQRVAEGFIQRANVLEQEGTDTEDDDMIIIAHILNINIIATPAPAAYVNGVDFDDLATADNNIEERNQIMPYYDHMNIIDTVRIQARAGHYVALRVQQPRDLNQQQRQNIQEIFALIQNGMLERARLINDNPGLAIRRREDIEESFLENYTQDKIWQAVELIHTALEQIQHNNNTGQEIVDLKDDNVEVTVALPKDTDDSQEIADLSTLAAELIQQEEALRQQQIAEDHRIATELALGNENVFAPVQFLPQEEILRQQQIAEDRRVAIELAASSDKLGICLIS